ncbi:MAG: hypothetical protein U0414_34290 [Polyangiaceae bacterium]
MSEAIVSAVGQGRNLRATRVIAAVAALCAAPVAQADGAEPRPEPVVEHRVEQGETCADIAKAAYGDPKHAHLLQRYNHITCAKGAVLEAGVVLVLPAAVTDVAPARLGPLRGEVRASEGSAAAAPVVAGQELDPGTSVATAAGAWARVDYLDSTRVVVSGDTRVTLFDASHPGPNGSTLELDVGELEVSLDRAVSDMPIRLALHGGGAVAASRRAIVDRMEGATSVQVLEGLAEVESGGVTVKVPANFGTRFVGNGAPSAPRPLAGPPSWGAATRSHVVLAPAGGAVLTESWERVPNASAYRVEVSRDAAFADLVVREEVPANATKFRAADLADGLYFMRVRVIDAEGFLGLPTAPLEVAILSAAIEGNLGQIGPTITASPYARVEFGAVPAVELAVGDGPFAPVPAELDLGAKGRPAKLFLRVKGEPTTESEVTVEYTHPSASIDWSSKASSARVPVIVTISGADGGDVHPRLRVHRGEEVETLDLEQDPSDPTGAKWKTMLNHPDDVSQMEVLDDDGVVLAHRELEYQPTKGPPRREPDDRSQIGMSAPPFSFAPVGAPLWWTPGADTTGSLGIVVASDANDGPTDVTGRVFSTAAIGPVGLDLQLRADGFVGERLSDPSGWAGARLRLLGGKKESIEIGPAVRVAFPITKFSRPVRLEGGFAIGSETGRWSWLVNVGSRFQLEYDALGAFTLPLEVVAGVTYQVTPWLRVASVVDGSVGLDSTASPCAICEKDGALPVGGLSLGAEAGTNVFGGVMGRFSPFSSAFGNVEGIFTFGARTDR